MSDATTKYGVLVGVDGSPESDVAIRWATAEAIMRNAPITLMHVVASNVSTWPIVDAAAGITEWQEEFARLVLERGEATVTAAAGDSPSPTVRTEMRCGTVAATMIEASREAFLAVVGSRGMGALGRTLMGSVSTNLLQHAHCAVAVLHADQLPAGRRTWPVVVGIDGTPASEQATAWAFDEASRRGVGLVALHAWTDTPMKTALGLDMERFEREGHDVLATRLAAWQEKYPEVDVRQRLVVDQPAHGLVDESLDAQLVVVGSHGRGGFAGMLLGSVSTGVAQSSRAPTIVVRGR